MHVLSFRRAALERASAIARFSRRSERSEPRTAATGSQTSFHTKHASRGWALEPIEHCGLFSLQRFLIQPPLLAPLPRGEATDNHKAALALYFMHHNFARIHKTLRVTAAMEAGVADHVWSLEEIAGLAK